MIPYSLNNTECIISWYNDIVSYDMSLSQEIVLYHMILIHMILYHMFYANSIIWFESYDIVYCLDIVLYDIIFMIQYCILWNDNVPHDMIQNCNVIWYNIVFWYCIIWYNIWFNIVWFDNIS